VVLVWWLLRYVDASEVSKTVLAINPLFLVASLLIYLLSVVMRAIRFQRLLKVPAKVMIPITFVHTCLLNLLPGIFGEMSYIYMVRRQGINIGHSAAVLIVCRVFDIAAVFILTLVALFFVRDAPSSFRTLLMIMGAALLLIFLLLVMFVLMRHKIEAFGRRVASILGIAHIRVVQWSLAKMCEVAAAIESIRGARTYSMIIVTSLLVWLFAYVQTYLLMVGFGYDVPFAAVALGTSLYRLVTILPISGLAGFGTTELSWAGAFIVLGISHDIAIVSAFSVHIMQLLSAIIVGLAGVILLRSTKHTPKIGSLQE
jgi:uncharacterized protein (TIRG00374 family)